MALINGLTANHELNGQLATLVKFDEEKGRWQVQVPGRTSLILLRPENLMAMTEEMRAELMEMNRDVDDYDLVDADAYGRSEHGPNEDDDRFDVVLARGDPLDNAQRVVDCLEKQGVCICDANAPQDLLSTAFDEAERLWEERDFEPPMRATAQLDSASQCEAEVWTEMLYQDEKTVVWINEGSKAAHKMKSLLVLQENMAKFCRGVSGMLDAQLGITYTHHWSAMLACYTGDQSYQFHIDNPSLNELPENGLRLSVCYFINPYLDPEDSYNGGGLEVCLTDLKSPSSESAARKARRRSVAPRADTLVLFLSQSMWHCMIKTVGPERRYALWLYCYEDEKMREFTSILRHLSAIAANACHKDSDDEIS